MSEPADLPIPSPEGTPEPSGPASPSSEPSFTIGSEPMAPDQVRALLTQVQQEAQQRLEQQYGWAKDLTPDRVQAWRQVFELADTDPEQFYRLYTNAMRGHPRYAHLLAEGGRAAQDPAPQPDLVAENGAAVYSAKQAQALAEWRERQLESRVAERLAPLEAQAEESRAWAEATRDSQQQVAWARQTIPGFAQFEPLIKQVYAQMPYLGEAREGEQFMRAIVAVLSRHLGAGERQGRQGALEDLRQKATATTLSPGRQAAARPATRTYKNTEDAFRAEFERQMAALGG